MEGWVEAEPAFKLRDFADALTRAANRARNVVIIMVITSVIVMIGTLDSMENGWAKDRLKAASSIENPYVRLRLGPLPTGIEQRGEYEEHYKALYTALARQYVESSLAVHAPVFGVTVDVNDLGAVGGFALIVILVMLHLAVHRERDGLSTAFERAKAAGQLGAFYDLVSMDQIFILPSNEAEMQHKPMRNLLWIICMLPLLAQYFVVAHDWVTNDTGELLGGWYNNLLLGFETIFYLIIVVQTDFILYEVRDMQKAWDDWAKKRFPKPT